MRIPSQINPFKEGDIVIVKDDPSLGLGVVSYISERSIYYEARPIASYQAFTIGVDFENSERGYYEIKDLHPAS